jgi:hypothetical protein
VSATTTAAGAAAVTPTEAQAQAKVIVGDVIDFRLRNEDGWKWPGGWVDMRLHEARFKGEPVYHVRTDASDEDFAVAEKLVFVPKLAAALGSGPHGNIYLFDGAGQPAIVSTAPGQSDFTPFLRVNRVSWNSAARSLGSVEEARQAESAGELNIEETDVVVNYPFVKWPGGELPVDSTLEKALEGGPLVSAANLERMTVRFKLHQCYPESYYIITDTSAAQMAPMMNVAAAPAAAGLTALGGTEKIYVFGNGIPGFAAMGFQPSVFASKAGEVAWSPMWEHVTLLWKEGVTPQLLTSRADVAERISAGDLQEFPGTPDTAGQSFAVNCPSPIIAPNTFAAPSG